MYYLPLLFMQLGIFFWLQRFNIDPKKEKGFMIRAKILNLAVWPIYFLAFVSVIFQKRLTYKVTPKGTQQAEKVSLSLFIPHFVIGMMGIGSISLSFLTHHQAAQHIFWAWINTVVMFYFVLHVGLSNVTIQVDKLFQRRLSLPYLGVLK